MLYSDSNYANFIYLFFLLWSSTINGSKLKKTKKNKRREDSTVFREDLTTSYESYCDFQYSWIDEFSPYSKTSCDLWGIILILKQKIILKWKWEPIIIQYKIR